MALRVICHDEMGKEAAPDSREEIKLKKVKSKDEMSLGF